LGCVQDSQVTLAAFLYLRLLNERPGLRKRGPARLVRFARWPFCVPHVTHQEEPRDLLGHHSVTLTEKVLCASGAEQSRFSGAASQQKGKFITPIITQNGFCTIFGHQN